MKRLIPLILIFVLATFSALAADGVDDRGNPNNPEVNDRANACFDGGSMAGKCDSTDIDGDGEIEQGEVDWHYTCGWFMIRFEEGLFTREEIPLTCLSLLPSEPKPEPQEVTAVQANGVPAGCYTDGLDSLQWPGGAGPSLADIFSGTTCSGAGFPVTVVFAASQTKANNACGGLGVLIISLGKGDFYICT